MHHQRLTKIEKFNYLSGERECGCLNFDLAIHREEQEQTSAGDTQTTVEVGPDGCSEYQFGIQECARRLRDARLEVSRDDDI